MQHPVHQPFALQSVEDIAAAVAGSIVDGDQFHRQRDGPHPPHQCFDGLGLSL